MAVVQLRNDTEGHACYQRKLAAGKPRCRNEKTGIGWVIAGKLLARKRPKLIPVYDSIVRCQFGAPQHVWMKLHGRLAENGGSLRTVLAEARATVGVDDKVSVLRAPDVILWRRHVKDHWRDKPAACPKRGTVEL